MMNIFSDHFKGECSSVFKVWSSSFWEKQTNKQTLSCAMQYYDLYCDASLSFLKQCEKKPMCVPLMTVWIKVGDAAVCTRLLTLLLSLRWTFISRKVFKSLFADSTDGIGNKLLPNQVTKLCLHRCTWTGSSDGQWRLEQGFCHHHRWKKQQHKWKQATQWVGCRRTPAGWLRVISQQASLSGQWP